MSGVSPNRDCERCGRLHDGSYGSGRFCDSFCAHFNPNPWNKGKRLSPAHSDAIKRGWVKRKQRDEYPAEREARRKTMKDNMNKYWAKKKADENV